MLIVVKPVIHEIHILKHTFENKERRGVLYNSIHNT